MLNPFFTASRYPWELPLARELYDRLVLACPKAKAEYLVNTAGMQYAAIAWGEPMTQVWTTILGNAVTERRLEALLERVLGDATLAAIHEVTQRVKSAGQGTGPDISAQFLLPGDVPFLNRSRLRTSLRRMREDTPKTILLVRGEPRSGKSMTRELVRVVAKAVGDRVIYLDESNATQVDKVAAYLLERLADAPVVLPPRDTTDDAWYRQVALEARKVVSAKPQRWWIIVDDLGPDAQGQPRMNREVLAFFHQFALLMADPEFSRSFRLVLLDYPTAPNHPPSKLKKTLLEEDKTAPYVETDVSAFVKATLDLWKKQYSEAELQQITQLLLKRAQERLVAAPEAGGMQTIYEVLVDWISETNA
jgi:hypothetical protein